MYDIVTIGGGAAGCMAAIRASEFGKKVMVCERNESIGKKVLITGKGRCNVTNDAPIETFIRAFGDHGRFFRHAFHTFSNRDTMSFFEAHGCPLKVERQGRVFPQSDRAQTVVDCLVSLMKKRNVTVGYGRAVRQIAKESAAFRITLDHELCIDTKRVILATGGVSYPKTGSRGDGFRIAQGLGHTISPTISGLVPLVTSEAWRKDLQGLALKNVRISFTSGDVSITSPVGEMLFTHFGISGPLVLDLSHIVVRTLQHKRNVSVAIDIKPGLDDQTLDQRLIRDITSGGGKTIQTLLEGLLPKKLVPLVARLLALDCSKKCNQITANERHRIRHTIKHFIVHVTRDLGPEYAMITAGGIDTGGINARTMESTIVKGLFFCGEIIDGCAPSGGYNLQEAWSTGYLAGESAAS